MDVKDWLMWGLGGGALMKLVHAIWRRRDTHRDAHRETTEALRRGELRFAAVQQELASYREAEDLRHNALDRKVAAMAADTAEVKGVVKEILVALNERKPGQGMNGDRK